MLHGYQDRDGQISRRRFVQQHPQFHHAVMSFAHVDYGVTGKTHGGDVIEVTAEWSLSTLFTALPTTLLPSATDEGFIHLIIGVIHYAYADGGRRFTGSDRNRIIAQ